MIDLGKWLAEHLVDSHGWDGDDLRLCWDLKEHHASYDHSEMDHGHPVLKSMPACSSCGGPWPWMYHRSRETGEFTGCEHAVAVTFRIPSFERVGVPKKLEVPFHLSYDDRAGSA